VAPVTLAIRPHSHTRVGALLARLLFLCQDPNLLSPLILPHGTIRTALQTWHPTGTIRAALEYVAAGGHLGPLLLPPPPAALLMPGPEGGDLLRPCGSGVCL
jgi:hypothetical protein